MTTTELEMYVREQFNMGLCEFVRHKVEAENLYDYELARILNVDGASVGTLRKAFGIKKADGFSRRFETTYGRGAIRTFKKMIENPDNTLADVAKHFGFTREYARQMYKKFYGCPYTEVFREKILARKRKKLEARMKSQKYVSLVKVIEKMRSLGFVARMTIKGTASALFINGYKVTFRCTSKPLFIGRNRYFRITRGIGSNGQCDFFICLCRDNGKSIHYVIPQHVMPRYGVCLSLDAGHGESKYAKFKEAWHLLTHESQTKQVS